MRLSERFNLWLCRKGRHKTLVWLPASQRPLPVIPGSPLEIIVASGLLGLANEVGWCSYCGRPVEWRS